MSAARDPVFGCLLEQDPRRLDRDGYAYHGKSRAHIVAWAKVNGPVPGGKTLDHLCRRRRCQEPTHLEPADQPEQERRKANAWRMRRQTCPRGHSMAGAAITPEGGRLCRTCQHELLTRIRSEA